MSVNTLITFIKHNLFNYIGTSDWVIYVSDELYDELKKHNQSYRENMRSILKKVMSPKMQLNIKLIPLSRIINLSDVQFNYTIDTEIGRGTFGTVYQVKPKINATKIINSKLALKMSECKDSNTINEINVLTQCDHPNIIKPFAIKTDFKYSYILMELMDNTIEVLLKYPLDERITLIYKSISQITDGLYYMWEHHNLNHLDIKPANILCNFKNDNIYIKICDFGWSLSPDESIIYKPTCTSGYRSIESYINKDKSKSDMWSVGMIINYLLTKTNITVYDSIKSMIVTCASISNELKSNTVKKNYNYYKKNHIHNEANDGIILKKMYRRYQKYNEDIDYFGEQRMDISTIWDIEDIPVNNITKKLKYILDKLLIYHPTYRWHITDLYKFIHRKKKEIFIHNNKEAEDITIDAYTKNQIIKELCQLVYHINIKEPDENYNMLWITLQTWCRTIIKSKLNNDTITFNMITVYKEIKGYIEHDNNSILTLLKYLDYRLYDTKLTSIPDTCKKINKPSITDKIKEYSLNYDEYDIDLINHLELICLLIYNDQLSLNFNYDDAINLYKMYQSDVSITYV